MKTSPAIFAALLLPVQALAGAQYTAEDVIRYFEQANAAAQPSAPSIARTAPAATRGIVIGEPAKPRPNGVVIGAPAAGEDATVGAPGAAQQGIVIGGAAATGDSPLAIPMTGAKAGYSVQAPVSAAVQPAGYDLMVTFELDSATLTPQARTNLEAFAKALASPVLAGFRFAVEGHTDATGSPEHNLKLSEARADSVVSYLVKHGVAPERLTAAGYGETRPRLDDPAHPENRRVETRRIE